jgi:plasmid stabilization system protein ParE
VKEVVWSQTALDDLDAALAHIAADNEVAAGKVLDRIEQTATGLGQRATGRRGRVAGTYEKSVTGLPYIIAYALRERGSGSECVIILRVIHSARNWPAGGWPE